VQGDDVAAILQEMEVAAIPLELRQTSGAVVSRQVVPAGPERDSGWTSRLSVIEKLRRLYE
jgi:hypothetical protein